MRAGVLCHGGVLGIFAGLRRTWRSSACRKNVFMINVSRCGDERAPGIRVRARELPGLIAVATTASVKAATMGRRSSVPVELGTQIVRSDG